MRTVRFPVADALTAYEEQRFRRLETLARLMRTTVAQLEQEERDDDIPNWNGQGEIMADESAEKVLAEGWDEVAKASASSGAWMKWENNQVHTINIFGKPIYFEKVWDGEAKKRVRVSVFVPEDGSIKQWDMAPGTLRDLAEERADSKNPFEDALFAVKRTGVGKETRFKMRYQRQLTAQEIAKRSDAGAATGTEAPDPF